MKRLTMGIMFLTITLAITSAAWAVDVHTVTSKEGPLCLTADGTPVTICSPGYGGCTVSWKEGTRYGFFYAQIKTYEGFYKFQLVGISHCNGGKIEGLFDIFKDGILVAEGVVGKIEKLDGDVDDILYFYAGKSQCNSSPYLWFFKAEINYRYDR